MRREELYLADIVEATDKEEHPPSEGVPRDL